MCSVFHDDYARRIHDKDEAVKVLFLTGAGISANAGIATYRDGGSSWVDSDLEKKSHANRYGNHLDELWDKHWGPVSITMSEAEPTLAHKVITEFQQAGHEAIVATQNIDNLHERAGNDNVAHLHGDMSAKCMKCKGKNVHGFRDAGAPKCLDCGSRKTRPDVVLFGEMLNKKLFTALEKFSREADYVIAVGTSLNVFPAAALVMDNAAKSIIINKQPTPFDKFAMDVFHEDADIVLPVVLGDLTA